MMDERIRAGARNRDQGVALLLVIMVLTALVVIGTPFAISMKLQEQGSRHIAADERAQLAQMSARNHAVAKLFGSHPSRETEDVEVAMGVSGSGHNRAADYGDHGIPNQKVDDLDEIDIRLDSALMVEPFAGAAVSGADDRSDRELTEYAMRDPRSRILDVSVEDEQGKVNINTALPTLLGNLFAGSHLNEKLGYEQLSDEIPLEDTENFPADDDPETVDGVVVIFNPQLFTMEAVSYRGKTETHLTGCFRGEYLSGTWPAEAGFPVFDLRAMKLFLHRVYDLGDGKLRTYRTPSAIREIADWSILPYFAKTLALFGLNVRNMSDYGLTPQMLNRAGLTSLLDDALVRDGEKEVDPKAYRDARKALEQLGVPTEALDLLEGARGKSGVVSAGEYAKKFNLSKREGLQIAAGFEGALKDELKKIRKSSRKYFPKAIEAYKQLYEYPGMETITAQDFHRVRSLITATSSRPAEWTEEQQVVGTIENNPLLGVPTLPVKHLDWFNAGTIVRIRSISNPSREEYSIVAAAVAIGGRRARARSIIGQGGVILREPLKHDYADDDAVISAMVRHPVNINTAPRKVLEACLTGVRSLASLMRNNGHRVTSKEARDLAAFLIDEMPVGGFENLRNLITEAAKQELIDDEDVLPILINAVNPNHSMLGVSTTGFCYATGDVYTIESTGVVNGPSGLELASKRVREIVEVAPPDDLFIEMASQDDFAFRLFQRPTPTMFRGVIVSGVRNSHDQNQNSTYLPGREGNLFVTLPNVLSVGWDFTSPHMHEGSIKSVTAQLEPNTNARSGLPPITFGEVEHFSDTVEGHEIVGGTSYSRPTRIAAGQNTTDPTNPSQEEDLITKPGLVEFWMRPRWRGRTGDRTLFDTVLDPSIPFRNRIQLYYEGSTQELVFRIMDDAQLPAGLVPSDVVSAAEIRHEVTPQTFADDTWYHITAIWGSTTPGDQMLLIDNRPVGENLWLTSLAQSFPARGGVVRVENQEFADRCPAIGALQVGSEVIEYDRKEGTSFFVRQENYRNRIPHGRGRRATARQDHLLGTPVTLYGFTVDVVTSDPLARTEYPENMNPAELPQETQVLLQNTANRLLVSVGGAQLDESLVICKRIRGSYLNGMFIPNGLQSAVASYPRVGAAEFVGPAATQIRVLFPPNEDPITIGFPRSGYLMVWHGSQQNTGGLNVTSWDSRHYEYIKYSNIVPGPTEAGFQTFLFQGLGRGMLGTQPFSAGAFEGTAVTRVYGVSVLTDSSSLSERYPQSGVVQLLNTGYLNTSGGDPTAQLPPEAEWIYYRRIAEEKYFIGDPVASDAFRGFWGSYQFDADIPTGGEGRVNTLSWRSDHVIPHLAGKKMSPVFRVDRPVVGRDDQVWVVETAGLPAQRLYELKPNRVHLIRDTGSGFYVSFRDDFLNNYIVNGLPKMKMFPSGSLPHDSSGQMTFGASASPGSGPGGPSDMTIDEIRFSRTRHVDTDFFVFPAKQSRRLTLDTAPEPLPTGNNLATPNVARKVIRRHYTEDDGMERNDFNDALVLLGRGNLRLKTQGNLSWRYREEEDPRSFGLGKELGLLGLNGEVIEYRYDLEQTIEQAQLFIAQDLPADMVRYYGQVDPTTGEWPPFNTNRDLRAEVWPEIEIKMEKGQLPADGGFIEMIGESTREIIYYEIATSTKLRNCLRGQLGTPVGSYVFNVITFRNGQFGTGTREIRARLLPQREVDLLKRGMLGTSQPKVTNLLGQRTLPLTQIAVTHMIGSMTEDSIAVESNADFPSDLGYMIRDEGVTSTSYEILGYQFKESGDNGALFARARDEKTGVGLFRGRYGTYSDAMLGAGMTFVEFPVRYHDRYQPQVESGELAYFQRQFQIPGAFWDSVEWQEEEVTNRGLNTQVRLVVRFDGGPNWDEEPTNRPGGLYQFTDGTKPNKLSVEAESIEVRMYFHYPQGSYGRNASSIGGGWNDSWKHCPAVDSIKLNYRKPWRVIHREDLPY